jgi:outer membrane protein assembly factor BamB
MRSLPTTWTRALAAATAVLLLVAGSAPAADASEKAAPEWPCFLGPNRDGLSAETGWKVWTDAPKVAWEREIGDGYSAVSVAGGRAYTMGGKDVVWCLDAASGAVVWSTPPSDAKAKHTQSTPAVAGGRVYALGMDGVVRCLSADDGKVVWTKDLPGDLGVTWGQWGPACSPLVRDGKVILDVGRLVVLDAATGAPELTAGSDTASYASPVVFTAAGKTCATSFNAAGLVVYDLATGKPLGRHPWKTSWDVNAAAPVPSGDRIFITSGYKHGCALLAIGALGLSLVYENKELAAQCQTPVLLDGRLYGVHGQQGSRGSLKCLDLATGRTLWETNHRIGGGLMVAGGKIVAMEDGGDLVIAEASPDAYKELARGTVLEGRCWTMPVLVGGRIYARNKDGKLVCVDVR